MSHLSPTTVESLGHYRTAGILGDSFQKKESEHGRPSILDVAKSQIIAYNDKDWGAANEALAADVAYDEVGTQRRIKGVEEVVSAWKVWAKALPDSKASFDKETVSGNTTVLEVTWRGTHTGPLQLPGKELAATGKKIELRACQVIEVSGGKVQAMRHYLDMVTMLRQLGAMS